MPRRSGRKALTRRPLARLRQKRSKLSSKRSTISFKKRFKRVRMSNNRLNLRLISLSSTNLKFPRLLKIPKSSEKRTRWMTICVIWLQEWLTVMPMRLKAMMRMFMEDMLTTSIHTGITLLIPARKSSGAKRTMMIIIWFQSWRVHLKRASLTLTVRMRTNLDSQSQRRKIGKNWWRKLKNKK